MNTDDQRILICSESLAALRILNARNINLPLLTRILGIFIVYMRKIWMPLCIGVPGNERADTLTTTNQHHCRNIKTRKCEDLLQVQGTQNVANPLVPTKIEAP